MGFKFKDLLKPQNLLSIAAAPVTGGLSLLAMKDSNGNLGLDYLTGAKSAREQNERNERLQREMNEQNIALQKETNETSIGLANSAHQREIADLKSAGLNPVLSAMGSGSATPTLGTATVSAPVIENEMPGGYLAQIGQVANIASTFSSAKQLATQANLNKAQEQQMKVNTALAPQLAQAEIAEKMAGAGSAKAQAYYNDAMTKAQEIENRYHTETGTAKDSIWHEKAIKSIKNSARREKNEWQEKGKQSGFTGWKYRQRENILNLF